MGISVDQWRERIGLFNKKGIFRSNFCKTTGCCTLLTSFIAACIISSLLLIGGVELNPGPTVAEVSKKLDEFIADFRALRSETHDSHTAIYTRLEAFMTEINEKVTAITNGEVIFNERIAALERAQTTNNTSLHEIRNDIASIRACQSPLHLTQPTNTPTLLSNNNAAQEISALVHEALETEKRKQNAIIFNLPDSDSFDNDKYMLHALFSDLGINDVMIQTISRFGRRTMKPRPLRLHLRSCNDVYTLLKAAPRLALLRDEWHNTSISCDRSASELKIHQDLIKELHQRREQGERVRLLDGKIVAMIANENRSHLSQTTLHNNNNNNYSVFSQLRVDLPKLTSQCKLSATAQPFVSSSLSSNATVATTTTNIISPTFLRVLPTSSLLPGIARDAAQSMLLRTISPVHQLKSSASNSISSDSVSLQPNTSTSLTE